LTTWTKLRERIYGLHLQNIQLSSLRKKRYISDWENAIQSKDRIHQLETGIEPEFYKVIELYERIHKMDNNANVFFLTAVSDFSGYKGGSKPLGEDRFIQKPIDGPELLKRITV
jgi:hypothetical protein